MGHIKPPKRPFKRRNVVGDALRKAREENGLSQAQLAAKLQLMGWDIGRTTWTKIELGERTLSDCELIVAADALGIDLSALKASVDFAEVRRILGALKR